MKRYVNSSQEVWRSVIPSPGLWLSFSLRPELLLAFSCVIPGDWLSFLRLLPYSHKMTAAAPNITLFHDHSQVRKKIKRRKRTFSSVGSFLISETKIFSRDFRRVSLTPHWLKPDRMLIPATWSGEWDNHDWLRSVRTPSWWGGTCPHGAHGHLFAAGNLRQGSRKGWGRGMSFK